MKRSPMALFLLAVAFTVLAGGQAEKTKPPKKVPCQPSLAACPDEGCGKKFDPTLNRRKNIRPNDAAAAGEAEVHTLNWMKKLDDPENFSQGDSREELEQLGEGRKITVVAYLLTAKQEGAESCNCGLTAKADTDNHLVLVNKWTVDKDPVADDTAAARTAAMKLREPESITAEFTPRVRQAGHPNFTREMMEPLIKATPQKALLVRVTGMLMFDSEHFITHALVRVNNWEIHPVLKLEYCTTGDKCKVGSDTGWRSIDE